MRKQDRSAGGAHCGKNQRRPARRDASRPNFPLEDGEDRYQDYCHPMLKHVGDLESVEKTVGAQRPTFRVGAQEYEGAERQEILAIVRQAIATRPSLTAAAR